MEPKQENNLKEYGEFLDCPQGNQKESTSNNTNTLTKKNGKETNKKEEKEKNTTPKIFFYSTEEKPKEKEKNYESEKKCQSEKNYEYENVSENNLEDGYFVENTDFYENYFQRDRNEDEKFTEFYDVNDNWQHTP